ncbi:MAG: hypothetical protein BWY75_02387 [bacterium ADurb.Bin425]|nr:MAG: hypothetical protein BWY75_02387 [bacterium ADurb.Bin425]
MVVKIPPKAFQMILRLYNRLAFLIPLNMRFRLFFLGGKQSAQAAQSRDFADKHQCNKNNQSTGLERIENTNRTDQKRNR